MSNLNIISENDNSTVITKYDGVSTNNVSYQSEAQLENEFIKTLCEQGYERLYISSEEELKSNLRKQLEKLNKLEEVVTTKVSSVASSTQVDEEIIHLRITGLGGILLVM